MFDNSGEPLNRFGYKKAILFLAFVLHTFIVISIVSQGDHFFGKPIAYDMHRLIASDFYSVYHGGVNMSRGQSPYDHQVDGVTPYFFPYRYLPSLAFVAQGFTWLEPAEAYALWVIILELLLLALLYFLFCQLGFTDYFITAATALLVSTPYFLEVYMGQFTFAAVVFFLLAVLAGNFVFRTSSVFASLLIKPIALPALVILIRERKGAVLIVVGLTSLATSIPYFFQHPEEWSFFRRHNLNPGIALGVGNVGLVEFVHLVLTWMDSLWRYNLGIIMKVVHWALLGISIWMGLFRHRHLCLAVSSILLAHFLGYLHVWEHHMSAVCAIGAIMLCCPDQSKMFYRLVLASLVLLALPTPYALFFYLLPESNFNDVFLSWPAYALVAVVLSKLIPTSVLFVLSLRR